LLPLEYSFSQLFPDAAELILFKVLDSKSYDLRLFCPQIKIPESLLSQFLPKNE